MKSYIWRQFAVVCLRMLECVREKVRESKREATVIQFFLMKNVSALTAGRPISKPLHSGKSIAHLFILLFELFVHLTATGWACDKCCFKGFAFTRAQCHIRRLTAHTHTGAVFSVWWVTVFTNKQNKCITVVLTVNIWYNIIYVRRFMQGRIYNITVTQRGRQTWILLHRQAAEPSLTLKKKH